MRTLALAVIDLTAFIELSDENVIDPDAAVRALESLAADLRLATPSELEALHAVLRERLLAAQTPAERQFFASFADNLGLPPARPDGTGRA